MHALNDYQIAALLLMLAATAAVIGLSNAAGYRRGRQQAFATAAAHYEPLRAAMLQSVGEATASELRARTALEQHQADAAALIADLTAQRDAAASLNTDQRTTLLQAANALQLSARTYTSMLATHEARNCLTIAIKLRRTAESIGEPAQAEQQEVAA